MEKAILSRINLKQQDCDISKEYLETIEDLIDTKEVQDLKKCSQHLATSRFQHSLNVSYYSFLICRKLGLDSYSAARAGLLHDLYYYDWKTDDERPMEGNHAKIHPIIALENAKMLTDTNMTMDDAILHHMWPLKTTRPNTSVGWIIQAVDKFCAITEMGFQSLFRASRSNNLLSYCILCSFLLTF